MRISEHAYLQHIYFVFVILGYYKKISNPLFMTLGNTGASIIFPVVNVTDVCCHLSGHTRIYLVIIF